MRIPRIGVLAALALLVSHCASDVDGSEHAVDAATTDASGDDAGRDAAPAFDGGDGGDGGACPAAEHVLDVADTPSQTLIIAGDVGSVSIADPSIFYPPGAPGGALAFSSLPAAPDGAPDQGAIATHVALSNDAGKKWTYVAAANKAVATTPPPRACPDGGTCTATLVNETSSILFDPTDAPPRRWKLFTHRYVVVKPAGQKDILLYTEGHIALYTAQLPSGPWSPPEVAIGWPGSSLSESGATYLPASDPSTAMCGAFGEPGATIAPDGSLHLALACIRPPYANPNLDIVVLRSTDHARSWTYAGTPLRGADGACFGGDGKRINGADLFTIGTTEYLMATPERGANGRLGCVVFPFSNVATVTLRRDAAGGLLAARFLTPVFAATELVRYAGACTFAEGATATGYTMSHLVAETGRAPEIHEIATASPGP